MRVYVRMCVCMRVCEFVSICVCVYVYVCVDHIRVCVSEEFDFIDLINENDLPNSLDSFAFKFNSFISIRSVTHSSFNLELMTSSLSAIK